MTGLISVIEGHGPPNKFVGALDGGNIWWVAPTYPIASLIWRCLKHALRDAWKEKSEMDRRIDLHTGGSISVRSADRPDGLRGSGLDGLVIDEAAFVKEEAWSEALRPALADKQGWAIFISTPCGQNWFHDLYQRAFDSPEMERWQQPTSCNPIISSSELEAAKLEVGPYTYSQEFEAKFVTPDGMFNRAQIEIIEYPSDCNTLKVRAWDLAASISGKRTAGVLLAKTSEPTTYIVEDVVKGKWLPGERDQIIKHTANLDGYSVPIRIEQEPGSGGISQVHSIVSALPGWDVEGVKVSGDKVTRADPLAAQAGIGRLKIVHGEWNSEFLQELESFPQGQYLDQVDALALGFGYLMDKNSTNFEWWKNPPRISEDDWRNENLSEFSREKQSVHWTKDFPE